MDKQLDSTKLPIRIIIVDDHPILREGLILMIRSQPDLEFFGEAGTGVEGIALFKESKPDVTLLDLKLPDLTGIEVLKKMLDFEPEARVIVLTTYSGDVQALHAIRAGAQGFLLKATLRHDLLSAIRAVHAGKHVVADEVKRQLAKHVTSTHLTIREIEVLKQIARGLTNKLVAEQLGVGEETVKAHVRSLLEKLEANDRTHAVTIGIARGFIDL
jgi:DNA-binding NarL/FixJ family response regulator